MKWSLQVKISELYLSTISRDNITSKYGNNNGCRIVDTADGRNRISSFNPNNYRNAIEYSYRQEDGKGIADEHGVLPSNETNRSVANRSR